MTLKMFPVIAVISLLAACASTKEPNSPRAHTSLSSQGCRASQVNIIGQTASETTLKRAQEQAGADKLRVMQPDRMYTTDYDPTRLSVRVNANNNIQDVYCG